MNATFDRPVNEVNTAAPSEVRQHPRPSGGPLATFLGLFSIGLGLAEMMRPAKVAARTGIPYRGLLRAYGLREVGAGVGILTARNPSGWLWARVAGDALDLATLAAAYAGGEGAGRRRAAESFAAVAGVTVLDVVCAQAHAQ
jgi:hypothetical protein